MKLKKFLEYSQLYSKDPKTFEKRVVFASPDKYAVTMFEEINSPEAVLAYPERPVVLWNNMELKAATINENRNHIFNQTALPTVKQIIIDFDGSPFLPKSTTKRAEVKSLKFPIVGHSDDGMTELRTYGKFKKSEKDFNRFSEKITPITRFDAIAFKKDPIHLQERINQVGFDVDQNRFTRLSQIEEALKLIHEKYSPDFYQATFIDDGKNLYLESVSNSVKLTPSQLAKIYEAAYESHYEVRLPLWFKKQLFEKYIKPYYSAKYLDSALLKPKHSIDFKKYI